MRCPRLEAGWLGVLVGVLWVGAAPAPAQPTVARAAAGITPPAPPLHLLPTEVRAKVRKITDKPTLSARAPAEEFNGQPALYHWLLDHPDRAGLAWRRLGTPCLEIVDRGQGRFGWADDQGSDLYWETILDCPQMRVWYAEGRARPGLLLPPLSVRAVVVLHHWQAPDESGRPRLHHQADLFLQTDSKTAALVARLMGPSAPRLMEQCVTQLQFFFSALTRYLDRYPDRAEALLSAPAEVKREER
jgi:hypothetical protein